MQVAVTALLGAALFQVRSSLAEPEALNQTIDLLMGAVGGTSVSLEAGDGELFLDGAPVSQLTPGATLILQAMQNHHTARLRLPPRLSAHQWRIVVETYASAPGMYATIDDLRDALRAEVADVMLSATRGPAAEADLRGAVFELPGLQALAADEAPMRAAERHDAERAALEAQLDPLLSAAESARDTRDYSRLAYTLIQIRELEEGHRRDLGAIVARERRRVISADILENLARSIAKPGTSGVVSRMLGSLGADGAAALISALSGAPGPHERRAYMDALVACRDCDDAIIEALGNPRSQLVRDAAEIAGRRGMERAVPMLSHLLKHPQSDVRTAAWHALELVGTPAAMSAFRT